MVRRARHRILHIKMGDWQESTLPPSRLSVSLSGVWMDRFPNSSGWDSMCCRPFLDFWAVLDVFRLSCAKRCGTRFSLQKVRYRRMSAGVTISPTNRLRSLPHNKGSRTHTRLFAPFAFSSPWLSPHDIPRIRAGRIRHTYRTALERQSLVIVPWFLRLWRHNVSLSQSRLFGSGNWSLGGYCPSK